MTKKARETSHLHPFPPEHVDLERGVAVWERTVKALHLGRGRVRERVVKVLEITTNQNRRTVPTGTTVRTTKTITESTTAT